MSAQSLKQHATMAVGASAQNVCPRGYGPAMGLSEHMPSLSAEGALCPILEIRHLLAEAVDLCSWKRFCKRILRGKRDIANKTHAERVAKTLEYYTFI